MCDGTAKACKQRAALSAVHSSLDDIHQSRRTGAPVWYQNEAEGLSHLVRTVVQCHHVPYSVPRWHLRPTDIYGSHQRITVGSLPELKGSSDTNSHKGITQPWLRSLDGLNSHDEAYRLSMSGGVATALVLPGSANAIGSRWTNAQRKQSNCSRRWSSFPD